MISLGKCNGSCNTPIDSFGRICVSNKIKEVKLNEFNMITATNIS